MMPNPQKSHRVPVTLTGLALAFAFLTPSGPLAWGVDAEAKLSPDLVQALRGYAIEETIRLSGETVQEWISRQEPKNQVIPATAVLNLDARRRAQLYVDVYRIDDSVIALLEHRGADVEMVSTEMLTVQIRTDLSILQDLTALPDVRQVRLAEFGQINAGSAQTEGDAVIRANRVRNELNINGSGIRVGVIADGIDGLAASIFRGDLPATGVTNRSFRADANIGAGSEGTAILEIIHDVAPGARLFFANFQTSIEFMAAQNWLADRTDLIVDSVSFFNNGPYDGTSAVSTQTASMIGRGIKYFTAVGNFADKHYQGAFKDTNQNGFHEFGQANNAGETLNMTLFPNSNVTVYLQWDDPFGSSGNNYDLFLTDPNNPQTIINNISSTTLQDGDDNPVEAININYLGTTPVTFAVAIRRIGNAAGRNLELFAVGTRFRMDEFVVAESSVPNNGDAGGGVLAIGAMDYRSAGDIEAFSSRGPTNDGRLKPDFVGPDGVSTTAPGFATFFGTSAAAAHAAAVGALILSASPNLAPAQVAGFLRSGAVELGNLGPDNTFGFGRVDAFQPVQTLVTLPPPTFFSAIDLPRADAAQGTAESLAGPEVVSSSFEVAGWAVASRGIQSVDIEFDGVVVARATYGLPRLDVCVIFANFPGCPNVGFVTQLSNMPPGNHTLSLRITDNTGNVVSQPSPPRRIVVEPTSITAFLDEPLANANVGANVNLRGWGVSPLGIRSVEVFVDGLLVQQANYGTPRPDVCAVFPASLGCPNVGFTATLSGLQAGAHQLLLRFTDNGGGTAQLTRTITVTPSQIRVVIDGPSNAATVNPNVTIFGWAIATDGVSRVEIRVDNVVVANATYGGSRPDVCQVFPGFPQCPNVGFTLNLTGLTNGAHTLSAHVFDTTGGTVSTSVNVTVTGAPTGGGENIIAGVIDSPTAGTVGSTFAVEGWAVATRGVKRVEIVLGGVVVATATYGTPSRPDVCAVFPGFPGCPAVGFTASVTATPGTHSLQIRVVDNSDATATFPETPISVTVPAAPPTPVPAGTYRGFTAQSQLATVVLGAPNTISAHGLSLGAFCDGNIVSAKHPFEITISGGAFTATGLLQSFDPATTSGTYSVSATFDAATSTFNGTLVATIAASPTGPCTTGSVTWSAVLVP